MSIIPAYLFFFFLRIRKYSGKKGYFTRRFSAMSGKKALIESAMTDELLEAHLILVPSEKSTMTFEPNNKTLPDGELDIFSAGYNVEYYSMFTTSARGHYLFRETAIQLLLKFTSVTVAAAIGVFIGILL